MRLSFYAAAALVAGGLQVSALPTIERSSIDLESPGQAELSKLDERAIDWWPATNCVSHAPKLRRDLQHPLTLPSTDLMYRDMLERLRNPKLVVRRHQNNPTEPGHDVLNVSSLPEDSGSYFRDWCFGSPLFSRSCGLACVNSNACFPAVNGAFNWQTLQMVTTNNEPTQMLLQMGTNGLITT
jgi:hypothetical protein